MQYEGRNNFDHFVLFATSFENGIKEGSLTSFEMTRIVIPNECEESFPSIFILCGRVQLMNHFVVNESDPTGSLKNLKRFSTPFS